MLRKDHDFFDVCCLKADSSSFIYASMTRNSVYKIQLEKFDYKEKQLLFKLPSNTHSTHFKIVKNRQSTCFLVQINNKQFLYYDLVLRKKSKVYCLDEDYCQRFTDRYDGEFIDKFTPEDKYWKVSRSAKKDKQRGSPEKFYSEKKSSKKKC